MISEENKVMLEMLGDILHGNTPKAIDKESWPLILNEMKAQTVFVLPYPYIKALDINDPSYRILCLKQISNFYTILEVQDKLVNTLKNQGISSVILKGAAAACSYPNPDTRVMGDIDILVLPENFEKAFYCLQEAGYATEEDLEHYHRHIAFDAKEGVHIELHHHFSSSDNEDQNKLLDDLIYEGLRHYQVVDVCGYKVPILPTMENGLVLLGHINQHLGTGLGLRQIIDWLCFVDKHFSNTYWNETFKEATNKVGWQRLAEVTTKLCSKYLNLNKDINWYNADDETVDDLLDYILLHGNFGRNDTTTAATVNILRKFSNPIKGFMTLQETGERTWQALRKYPFLKPFAWLYQIFRWIIRGTKKGATLSSVYASSKQEKTETELLERLGVTRL